MTTPEKFIEAREASQAQDSSDAAALLEWLSSMLAAATPKDESHRVPEDGKAVAEIKDLQNGVILLHLAHCLAAAADAGAGAGRSLKRLNSTAAFARRSAPGAGAGTGGKANTSAGRKIPVRRVRAATNPVFAKMMTRGDMTDALEQLGALGIRHFGTTDRIIDGDVHNLLGVLQMTRTWYEVNRAMVMRGFVALECVGLDSNETEGINLEAAPLKRSASSPPRRDAPPIPSSAVVSTEPQPGQIPGVKKTNIKDAKLRDNAEKLNPESPGSKDDVEKSSGNAGASGAKTTASNSSVDAAATSTPATAQPPPASEKMPAAPSQEPSPLAAKQAVLQKIDGFLAQSLSPAKPDVKLDVPEKRAKPRKKSWHFRGSKTMDAMEISSSSDSVPTTKAPSSHESSLRASASADTPPPVEADLDDSPAGSAKPRTIEEELVALGIPRPKCEFPKMRPGHRRDEAAQELLTTEISYGVGLHMTTKIFLKRLRSSGVVTDDEVRAIFSNIEVLCGISGQLERELRTRIDAWDPEVTKLGDIMIKFVPFMKGYQAYCANFDRANATVKEVLARNPKEIATALDGAKRLTAGQDLESLLLTPVQRVPRYVMLIKEVLKLTPETHPDFSSLTTALEKLQEVGQLVNTGMAKKDESAGFDKTLESVEGIKAFMLPHRKFVAEFLLAVTGQLAVVSADESVEPSSAAATEIVTMPTHVWAILFTDMIFLTSVVKAKKSSGAKRKLLHALPLSLLWISASGFKDKPASGPHACSLTMEDANGNIFIFRGQNDDVSGGSKAGDRRSKATSRVRSGTANASILQAASLASNFDSLVQFVELLSGPSCAPEGKRALDRSGTRSGAIQFTDPARGHYEGEFLNARPHGAGVWWMADGSIYIGEIHNAKFNGTGKMVFALTDDPITREGASGAAVLRLIEGGASAIAHELGPRVGYYDGTWKDGKMEGAGVYCWAGSRYEGSFHSNKFHGQGTMKWANGDTYEGQWEAGLQHGSGKYTTAAMSVYDGDWVCGAKHGQGSIWMPDGFKYLGDFVNGCKTGHANITYRNGDVYDGDVVDGMRHGEGTLISEGGWLTQTGTFVADKLNGTGTWRWKKYANVEMFAYSGEFKNGLFHGHGEFRAPNHTYIGAWVKGRRHGSGKQTDCVGTYDGEWRGNERCGVGTFTSATTDFKFTGTFKDNEPTGRGIGLFKNVSGEQESLVYVDGRVVVDGFPDLGVADIIPVRHIW